MPSSPALLLLIAGLAMAAPQPMIFWLDALGAVYTSRPDGSARVPLVTQGLKGPDGIAVDPGAAKVYWSNMNEGTGKGSLQRANLDGSQVEYVVPPGGTHTPKQIQLDLVHGMVYWCDRDGLKIQRCDLNGGKLETLVTGLQNPVGMALDVGAGFFYWSDRNAGTIRRARMEMPPGGTPATRSDIETLFSGLPRPIDLALDIPRRHLYWTDREEGTVFRAGMDIPQGQTAAARKDTVILVRNLSTPIGLSLDLAGGKLYFTELPGIVGRANLDGTAMERLWDKPGAGAFTGITFVPASDPVSIRRSPVAGITPGIRSCFGLFRNVLGRWSAAP